MAKMKAMNFTDKLPLQPVIRPVPEPQAGEILIQVSAVGVTRTEKLWSTTSHYADGTARSKAIPGHEFSGTVVGLGAFSEAIFSFPHRSGLSPDCLADGMAGTACPSKITERRTSPYTRRGWGGGTFRGSTCKIARSICDCHVVQGEHRFCKAAWSQ